MEPTPAVGVTITREEAAAGARSAQAMGDKKTAGELSVVATTAPSKTVELQKTATVVQAKDLGNVEAQTAIKSQFETLVEYLRVRADALLKGLPKVTYGGDYKAEFDRGGAAKSSFDAAWPGFLNTCRGSGIRV